MIWLYLSSIVLGIPAVMFFVYWLMGSIVPDDKKGSETVALLLGAFFVGVGVYMIVVTWLFAPSLNKESASDIVNTIAIIHNDSTERRYVIQYRANGSAPETTSVTEWRPEWVRP